ncbi:hypothetical protein PS029_20785 [Yersinia pestis]|nr:hypothetical protein [Yersinia pestis]
MRQRLITLKGEEFYKIMVSSRPWLMEDQSILPKPTFFFGDAVPDDITYQRRSFQFSFTADGEKKTVTTRSMFDRTVSILSLAPTCPKREDPPSWVRRTNVIKTGVFVGGSPGYTERSPVDMDLLMPSSGYQGSDYPSVDLRPVGLGIFSGDGSNWIKPFRLRGRFNADSEWKSWTDRVLLIGGAVLKEAGIFDAVRAFRETVIFSDEAFMAMLESFLPQTNTFVVTNGEIGFSLKELSAITGLPILGKLYEEFMPIDSVLEGQSEEFRLLYFQLVAFYDFLKEKEGLKVRSSSWKSFSSSFPNFFDSRESSDSVTQEAGAQDPSSKKILAMQEELRDFCASTNAICPDIALRRDLAVYLTYWLGEAIFAGGDGTHIRPHCIFPACQMAFGEQLALVPALYSYLCTELQAAAFLVRLGLPMNRVFSAHIFYSWYVYHCPGFHRLGAAQDDDPLMIRLAKGKAVSESLLFARMRIRRFRDVEMGQSSVKLSPELRKKAFDFGASRDSTRAGSGRHYSLTNAEREWLFSIRVGTMVYRRHLFVDIQPYVPSRFALQLGFSQGVVGAPSSMVKRFGGLQDGRNAWAFYSAEDTTAMISYPVLLTSRTAGFAKWFAESFSAYRGLSKKELDVKLASGKGLGKSDGIRREEVWAFLSGEKHKIGFLGDQGVIGSEAVREIPDEALEQLEQEEAELGAWMQAAQRQASVESTGKSRPSSEESSGKPDSDSGAGSSKKRARRSKRRRSHHRSKGQHEDSPDLEVPLTINEDVPVDADEPPEKRSREEETVGEGMILPFSLSISFHGIFSML